MTGTKLAQLPLRGRRLEWRMERELSHLEHMPLYNGRSYTYGAWTGTLTRDQQADWEARVEAVATRYHRLRRLLSARTVEA